MYFRLVILNAPQNGDGRPPGILQRIPSTQLKLQPVGLSPTRATPLPVKCILGQPARNVANPSEMSARVEPAALKTIAEDPAEPRKDQAEIDRALEEVRTTCPFCDKRFSNVAKLENHVSCVHRLPHQCDKCKKAYHTEQALDEHKVIHQPDYFFECETCHVKYKSEGTMKRHYIRVHSNDESSYICEHCGRCYKLKIDLTQHIRRSHVHDQQICRYCGKVVKDVKGHEWKHQRQGREERRQFACHLCTKKFCHRSRLDKHLRVHEKGGFKCADCGKEFRGTKELSSHRQYSHGRGKKRTCIVCQKIFTSTSNYYQHVLTHAGIRPYKCDICEEDFTQRSSVLRHRRQHPGPLPPLQSHPQVADLARNYLQKLQNDQVDKSCVLNTKT